MPLASLTRRDFITTVSAGAAAVALLPFTADAAEKKPAPKVSPTKWPIGCFNRPWVKWTYDEALDSIKAAGYRYTGLLTPTKTEVFTNATATPEYLNTLKQRIAKRGLRASMTALRVKNTVTLGEAISDTRKQIENAHTLGVEFALTFGVDKPAHYEQYFKVMADAAAFAAERKIKLVMKPHGGGSGSSDEIVTAMKAVNHANFKIWYDAGNIIHYTGKDPVAELDRIAEHVTGFCAKDCAEQKGDVMLQFGEGKVDFTGVFTKLKAAGFSGPIMVECCKIGASAQETMENARANRIFLDKVLATI